MKANLARFTWALTLLAIMALSVGAGMRWYAGDSGAGLVGTLDEPFIAGRAITANEAVNLYNVWSTPD